MSLQPAPPDASYEPARARPPPQVRLAAGFFLLATLVGLVGTGLDVFASLERGVLLVPVPLAIGVTGLALVRGLRRGSERARTWARGIAVAAAAGLLLMVVIAALAPAAARFSALGGSWPVASVLPVLLPLAVLGIVWFVWLFRALGDAAARRFFAQAPLPSEALRPPRKEAAS